MPEFSVYLWHSVNLIPHGGYFPIAADEESPIRIIQRRYWATVFGVVFNLDVPFSKLGARNTPVTGPCWSRRKRSWYWAR